MTAATPARLLALPTTEGMQVAYRRILIRRDTAANWTATNPTLAAGELGGETDTGKVKLGNGSTAWNSLPYQGGVTSVNGQTGVVTGLAPTNSPTFTGTVSLPNNTITADMIATGAVTEGKLGTGAVTSGKIADGTIVNVDISATAAINTTKITNWENDQVILTNQLFS